MLRELYDYALRENLDVYKRQALDGTLEQYLGEAAGMHGLED